MNPTVSVLIPAHNPSSSRWLAVLQGLREFAAGPRSKAVLPRALAFTGESSLELAANDHHVADRLRPADVYFAALSRLEATSHTLPDYLATRS